MIPAEAIDLFLLFLQENNCVCRLRKEKRTESVELYSRRILTERMKNTKRHFSLIPTARLLINVWATLRTSLIMSGGEQGPGLWEGMGYRTRAGARAGSPVNNFEHSQGVPCDL